LVYFKCHTKDNPYDIKLGSHKAKINAIMPIIKPLPPGKHEIRTEVFQDIPSIIMNDVPLHRVITYNLTVEPTDKNILHILEPSQHSHTNNQII
jgi:hypothetical protein